MIKRNMFVNDNIGGKAWCEPGPFSPSYPLTSSDSPGSPCWKVAPEGITVSEVGPPGRSSVPCLTVVITHIFQQFVPDSSELHTRKTSAVFLMEGRNARRTEKLHRGGAGKGEGAAGKRIGNGLCGCSGRCCPAGGSRAKPMTAPLFK